MSVGGRACQFDLIAWLPVCPGQLGEQFGCFPEVFACLAADVPSLGQSGVEVARDVQPSGTQV